MHFYCPVFAISKVGLIGEDAAASTAGHSITRREHAIAVLSL